MSSLFATNIAVSGSDAFIVWQDNRDGNYEVYYKLSIDGGINWDVETRLTYDTSSSTFPSVSISGSNVHIIWCDNRDGNNEIYYKLSTNKGLSWGADTRLTNDTSSSTKPFISISNSVLHVVWTDNRDGNYEIYYKRNPTGNVGIQNINSEIPKEYKLMQNYPNPFNPSTVISFSVPDGFPIGAVGNDKNVVLKVYDILGKEIATLVNEPLQPGTYEATFDGSNLMSGVYFYRLQSGEFTDTKRMLMIK
jgi:hypothetical protein